MSDQEYHPLIDTLRLYAGWLLACLFAVYALGIFQKLRALPWDIGILDEWVDSPLILHVTFTTFVFLLLSTVHRMLGRGLWKGIALTGVGFLLIVVFRANT